MAKTKPLGGTDSEGRLGGEDSVSGFQDFGSGGGPHLYEPKPGSGRGKSPGPGKDQLSDQGGDTHTRFMCSHGNKASTEEIGEKNPSIPTPVAY